MSRPLDRPDTDATDRRYSRRSVLRGSATALGLAAGAGGIASAQNETSPEDGTTTPRRTTMKAVILEQEQWEDLTGLFVHISGVPTPLEASVADSCDFVNWENNQTSAYDVIVLDRTEADIPQARTTLYMNDRVELDRGALFVINRQEACEGGYVGLWIEQIGAQTLKPAGVPPAQTEGSPADVEANGGEGGEGFLGAAGPGFGVVGGAAGLLGGGWLLGRDREE